MKTWIFALVALTFSFGLATPSLADHELPSPPTTDTYNALTVFGEIFDQIRRNHVDEHESQKLIEEAINGMMKALDKHSSYVTPDDYQNMQDSTSGQYSGIGAEVSWDEEKKGVIIIRPMEGSPALRDGLKPNDLITEVDGDSLKDLDLLKAINMIKGPTDSKVKFKVIREGEDEPLMITVTRGRIEQKVVQSRVIDDAIMYFRLDQFNAKSSKEVKEAVEKMLDDLEDGKKYIGLIFDVRGNPGGLLGQAIKISNMFLDEGLIVETRPRGAEEGRKHSARQGQIVRKDLRIVVMIDGGSASASEIIAGTFQDLKRAVILGVKSFGKGSVQTVMRLSNGGALRLTTAKYYTAGGTSPHGVGISPDIEVTIPEDYWKEIPPADRATHIGPQLKMAIEFLKAHTNVIKVTIPRVVPTECSVPGELCR